MEKKKVITINKKTTTLTCPSCEAKRRFTIKKLEEYFQKQVINLPCNKCGEDVIISKSNMGRAK